MKLKPKMTNFQINFDYKYFNIIILIGIINIYIFYHTFAPVDVQQEEATTDDWRPTQSPARYLQPYKGAVLVRYKDSTYYRLGLKPRGRVTRCAREWRPEDEHPRRPSPTISNYATTTQPSEVLVRTQPTTNMRTNPIFVPMATKKTLPKCPLNAQRSQKSSDSSRDVCDYSSATTTKAAYVVEMAPEPIHPTKFVIIGVQLGLLLAATIGIYFTFCRHPRDEDDQAVNANRHPEVIEMQELNVLY